MKKDFAKSAAVFTAAGLMMFGTAAPVCAEEAGKETQFIEEAACCGRYDPSILEGWKKDELNWLGQADHSKAVDPDSIEPDRYYILETFKWMMDFEACSTMYCDYKLIKIGNIYPESRFPGFEPELTADYTDIQTGEQGRVFLKKSTLFNLPVFKSATA